jgi:hypothetical protein
MTIFMVPDSLTLIRKEADGRWRLARDANLLAIVPEGS